MGLGVGVTGWEDDKEGERIACQRVLVKEESVGKKHGLSCKC